MVSFGCLPWGYGTSSQFQPQLAEIKLWSLLNAISVLEVTSRMLFLKARGAKTKSIGHLNFQKWSENGVFCTLVTSKCASRHDAVHFFNISASKSAPKLRCLCILTSKCASRHNGVQFLISHLPRWLCTRRFCESTFRPSGATKHWENVFSTFSHALIFFLLIFFRLTLSLLCLFPPLLLHLSILSEVLPSKLPSAKYRWIFLRYSGLLWMS